MATNKYTHGKSTGTSDRKSSGRLAHLSGETSGAIKKYDIKGGVPATPKIQQPAFNYYKSQPLNVPGAIQIPDAAQAPDNSKNIQALADMAGEINQKMLAAGSDFWTHQKAMDTAARKAAERKAAEGETEESNANMSLNKSKALLEEKAKTDPDAATAYGLFASMDQRVDREYVVVEARNRGLNTISNLENFALEAYNESFNDESRRDGSGEIVPLNPSTEEFRNLLVEKIKTEVANPRAYVELRERVQGGITNATRSVSKVHGEYKDTKGKRTFGISLGNTVIEASNASEEKLQGMSFTGATNHYRLETGTSIASYQKNVEPIQFLTTVAEQTILNSDRKNISDATSKSLTMLLNTKLGAGKGTLLSKMVGGEEVLKKLWKRAINEQTNEAYRINDQVDTDNAEKGAETWSLKILSRDNDADLTTDGIDSFGTHTTYNINGKDYKVKVGPNTVNLQGILTYFRDEKRNSYNRFDTAAEIKAYNDTLDDQLSTWLKAKGIGEQQSNDTWLRNRIQTSTNAIETEALINHFANNKWINEKQKNFLLQNNTLQTSLKQRQQDFIKTMKQPYIDVEGRLKSLFQSLDTDLGDDNKNKNDIEPEKWSSTQQGKYRKRIADFKTFATETFNALNDDTYEERIEKIKAEEIRLLAEIDKEIEAVTKGQTSGTTTTNKPVSQQVLPEKKDSPPEDDNRISIEEHSALDVEERKNYRPIGNSRGRIQAYELKPVKPITPRSYIQELGGLKGRGNDQSNADLRTEVTTTAIYDADIFEKQMSALEFLSTQERDGSLNWEQTVRNLNDNRIWGLRDIRNEVDFESIDKILRVTGLTPKEFFTSQAIVQGKARAEELGIPFDEEGTLKNFNAMLDKLFIAPNENLQERIGREDYNKLNKDDKNRYEFKGGRNSSYYILKDEKKNNEISSSILDRGTLVASTNLEGVLSSPKQEMETEMLDIIHSGESTVDTKGGGYEAFNQGGKDKGKTVLGFSGTYGDHPANEGKKLTEMTIQEILEIQDSGYNSDLYPWTAEGTKKWQASGGIHAAGRYQLLRAAIRDAMKFTGIKPTEKFTPEIQDKLAIAYLLHYGPSKWTSMVENKELKELLEKYNETDWTKSSTMSSRSDIA